MSSTTPLVRKTLRSTYQFLSSYGLAGTLFILLLILTFFGTLEQGQRGLFETQKKYFESLFVVHHIFDKVPVLLPGGYLLMSLLTINLIFGGVIRMRKGWRQAGVLVVHAGILLLMASAFITHRYAIEGHLTLYENQRSDEFLSYHHWELAVTQAATTGSVQQFVVPDSVFADLAPGETTTFKAEALPFDLQIDNFYPNASLQRAGPMAGQVAKVVDGQCLLEQPRTPEQERNVAGAYVTIREKNTGATSDRILYGMAERPAFVTADGDSWLIELRRQRWELPFTIVLDQFTRELYPRTNTPRVFMSDVTKIEKGSEEKLRIAMNEPLRYHGFTLFQASWGPQDAAPGDPLFSTFAVVRNPADQFPLYACIIITIGLVLHFSMKLSGHIRKSRRALT